MTATTFYGIVVRDRTGDDRAEERHLLARLRAGDERAFVVLVERHQAPMVRLAKVYVGGDAVAEEVVQDAWSAVVRGINRLEGRSSLKTWLFSIVKNRASSAFSRERRSVPLSSLEYGDEDTGPAVAVDRFISSSDRSLDGEWAAPPRPWEDAGRRLLSLELRGELRRALEDLPRRQRTVVGLRDVEGLEAAEVRDLLAVSEANQRVLLHRGRARLRRALEEGLDRAPPPGTRQP
ncbi:MAG: RNA polymerase sigma factor [Pseudonocardiaceae bacterium]